MGGGFPPKATLMAPAALYLTAILEYVTSVCPCLFSNRSLQGHVRVRSNAISYHGIYTEPRHILSNVGRVASRDSSRSAATANDLFVALCEDHSIYGFFKTMKGTSIQCIGSFIQDEVH